MPETRTATDTTPMTRFVDAYLRSTWGRALVLLAVVVQVVFYLVALPGFREFPPYRIDFDVYYVGAKVFLNHGELYGQLPPLEFGTLLPFTYPPISAALFTPFTLLHMWIGSMVMTVISLACLIWVMRLALGRMINRPNAEIWWLTLAATAVALEFGPVRDSLNHGQVNIFLMFLVMVDVTTGRGRPWRGILTGLAIAIKLTPAVFLLYFLLRRDWRSAIVSMCSFAFFTAIGFALRPHDSYEYWVHTLRDTGRIGRPWYSHNQSFRGELLRLGIESQLVWIVSVAAAGVLIAWAAWKLLRVGADLAALISVAFAALLGSPLSWDQHWVWIAPLIAMLVVWSNRAGAPHAWWLLAASATVIFLIAPQREVPTSEQAAEKSWTWWEHILGSSYLIWAVIALAAFGALAARAPADLVETGRFTPRAILCRARRD